MSKIIKIMAFFLFFVMCFCVKDIAAVEIKPNFQIELYPTLSECKANCTGTCTAIGGFLFEGGGSSTNYRCNPTGCASSGTIESKYTASGCDYTTLTRECCSNGSWTDWGGECCDGSPCCPLNQCFHGGSCVESQGSHRKCVGNIDNATGGTQYRQVSCGSSGWSYGLWSGACTCATGYRWNGQGCTVPVDNPCTISSCPSGQHLINAGTSQCCCEYDSCGQTSANELVSRCRCVAGQEEIPYSWVAMGTNCRGKVECGTSSLPTCNSSLSGTYYTKWDSSVEGSGCGAQQSDINGKGMCREYLCRQG